MIYMAIQKQKEMLAHSKKQAQIRVLLLDEVFTEILAEYSDYNNIFSAENAAKFLENTGMNEHIIELKEDKQPPFGLIYSFGLVELETLKTYIETNLANGFIRLFKFPAGALIFFNRKPNENFRLCIDYQGFNNITIKNRYPLPLIGKLLNRFDQTKRFI